MKKNWVFLGALLILCNCSKHAMMTMETFENINMGTPISTVVQNNGEPYSVDSKHGVDEYIYIERVTSGNQLIYENHYKIFVKNGVVTGKKISQETVPPFDLIYQDDPNHNQYP